MYNHLNDIAVYTNDEVIAEIMRFIRHPHCTAVEREIRTALGSLRLALAPAKRNSYPITIVVATSGVTLQSYVVLKSGKIKPASVYVSDLIGKRQYGLFGKYVPRYQPGV